MKTNFVKNIVKAAKRTAFLLSLVLVAMISLSCVAVCAPLFLSLCNIFDITGTLQFVCALIFLLGPVLELAINIECNLMALVDRVLPGFFPCRMPFECFSFWKRMLHA